MDHPAGVVAEFSNGISPNSDSEAITAGPDGNLWFIENDGNRIGRITPAGVITEFPGLRRESFPVGIAAGPDGNMWFTEQLADRIGRMTTAGVVTEFSKGISPDSQPAVITAGPDGNLWFTEAHRESDRPGDHGGGGHRVLQGHQPQQPPGSDHGRPRREPLVHRALR